MIGTFSPMTKVYIIKLLSDKTIGQECKKVNSDWHLHWKLTKFKSKNKVAVCFLYNIFVKSFLESSFSFVRKNF